MVVFKINSIIMKKSLLFLAVLFVLTGCQKESILPETASTPQLIERVRLNKGITEYTVVFEGTTRKYTVNTPLNYNRRKSYPLVLVLKGKKGTTERLISSMSDLINTRQYIAVYAEPVSNEGWNVGANEVDQLADVRFIESVISTLTSSGSVKENKIYCLGFSYGGSMANYLALNTSIFAAISPVAGSLYEGIETTSIAPVSVLMIHGEQDNSVPYEGGYSHGYVFYSAQQTAQIWSINNGCNASPVLSTDIPGAEVYDYSGCDNNKDVILFSVPNSGHDVFSEFDGVDMFNYVFDFFGNHTL
jgi:polyhydroxybutyrate depolymerase